MRAVARPLVVGRSPLAIALGRPSLMHSRRDVACYVLFAASKTRRSEPRLTQSAVMTISTNDPTTND